MVKNSEKKYLSKLKELRKHLDAANRIFITTHKLPDGDALGATLALKIYLEKSGKQVDLFYKGQLDAHFRFLPCLENAFFVVDACADFGKSDEAGKIKESLTRADLVIICDAGELFRVGFVDDDLRGYFDSAGCEQLIFIDHHSEDIGENCLLGISSGEKAATCQIIYDFFCANEIEIGKDAATCLLTGLFTDTGGFLHANTTSEVMEMASFLMKKGASLSKIAKKTFANKNIKTLKIWGRALARARLNKENKMAFSYVTREDLKECGAQAEDLSGVTNILGAAEESIYSLFLAETEKNKIKASLRSEEYKKFDVSSVAKLFGGGGHPLASGFEVKGKIVKDSGKMVIA